MNASLSSALSRSFSRAVVLVGAILTVASTPTARAALVPVGSRVTFLATADGSPAPTFQWKKNGAEITGATDATLVLAAISAADAGTYRVTASNIAGSADSADEILSVDAVPPPVTVAPVFSVQPAAQQVVTAGASVTFSAAASGTPAPTYQWSKDGSVLPGATSGNLTLGSVTPANAGSYQVVATNSAGSASSSAATLVVNTPPVFASQPPALQTAVAGTMVNLNVTVTGSPAPSLQWNKNGLAIPGATAAALALVNLSAADAATYTVDAANAAGTATSTPAVVVVNTPPVIITQPAAAQAVTAGSPVVLSVAATGNPAPAYQWSKNGVALGGATASTLTFGSVSANDAGTYTAVAGNFAGSVTSSPAVITVNTPPAITLQPVATQSVSIGASVTLNTTATGAPAPTYQWRKNGTAVAGATGTSFTLGSITATDAATYTVVVTNAAGSVTSSPAVVIVATPPVISTQPVATQTVLAGTAVSLKVAASGTPAPAFQWKKNGTVIAGGTAATLTFAGVALTDAATYTVVATNSAGTATSTASVLVVNAPPVITRQPVGQTVATKTNVTFTVAATGFPAPTYQWKKNGTRINGATSTTLKLTQVRSSDAATYAVDVRNSLGTVTSTDAKLVVGGSTPATSGYAAIPATTDTATPADAVNPSRIINVSVRSLVEDDRNLIAGFVLGGDSAQPVLLRGVGPTLETLGVDSALREPRLALYTGRNLTAANAGWSTADDAMEIRQAGAVLGAFRLAEAGRDAALLPTLAAGAYTVQLSGKAGTSGVALLEAFTGLTEDSTGLVNLSVRAQVGAGTDNLQVGFVVSGDTAKRVLLRAVGPTLSAFGLSGVLANPRLELFRNGTSIETNDNWGGAAELRAVFQQVGAFDLADGASRDAVLLVTLEPGSYAVAASGVGGSTGLALVEVYDVP